MTIPRPRTAVFSLLLLLCPATLPAGSGGLSLKVAWNNPFRPSQGEVTRFEYLSRGKDTEVRLTLFDASGRRVRVLADHPAQDGVLYVQDWDGADADGLIVEPGVYFAVLEGDNQRSVRRVAVGR